MHYLTLLFLAFAGALAAGAAKTDNDLCKTEIKCHQTEYKEYVKCLSKRRVKRQTCNLGDSNSMLPQVVDPVRIQPCNDPMCRACTNSCMRYSCTGPGCDGRCNLSCQEDRVPQQPGQVVPPLPPRIVPPLETFVQPLQSNYVQPIVLPANNPHIQSNIQPAIQTDMQSNIQPAIQTDVQSNIQPAIQTDMQPNIQPVIPSDMQSVIQPAIPPVWQFAAQPAVPPVAQPLILPVQQISYPQIERISNTSSIYQQKEITATSPNITTIIKLTNIVNNTNVVNVPTNINNTNINNLDLGTNTTSQLLGGQATAVEDDVSKTCCIVVQPKVCERINSSKGGIKCLQRRHHTCGEQCTSDTLHAQVRQPCQGPPESCPPQVAYVPQPQPRCSYQPAWPYVSCGRQAASCEGCYDHYGYGFQQYHGTNKPSCSGCYDDGYQPGSLYRQGPFYQQGYYHMPPAPYMQPPASQTSCGNGCFGNQKVDPVFGAASYSPYGISPFYYPPPLPPFVPPMFMAPPQMHPQADNLDPTVLNQPNPGPNGVQIFPESGNMPPPPFMPMPPQLPCFFPPYYQPSVCPPPFMGPMFPPPPGNPGFPMMDPNNTMPLPPGSLPYPNSFFGFPPPGPFIPGNSTSQLNLPNADA